MQPYLKKGKEIEVDDLLPENMREKKRMTKEEAKKELEDLKRRLKIK